MNRKELKKLSTQLKRLHKALSNTIVEIEGTLQALNPNIRAHSQSYPTLMSPPEDFERLRKQWAEIRAKVEAGPDPDSVIRDFIANSNKRSLRQFIVANALPINPKDSKEAIRKQLIQILRVTKIIRGA